MASRDTGICLPPSSAASLVLYALPLATQGLWFRLLFSATIAEAGRFVRFHCEVSEALALLFPASRAETASALENLIAVDFVRRDEDGRTLWLLTSDPPPRKREPLKLDARERGARGGRPRTGETAREARQRRDQPSLLLPLPNRREGAQETLAETLGAATTTTLTDSQSVQSQSPLVAPVETVKALGEALAELSDFDGARSPVQHRPIRKWLAAGASPGLIRQVVARVAARGSYEAGRVHSLYYFDRAVLEALEAGEEVGEVAAPIGKPALTASAREAGLSPWALRYQAWLAGGQLGPMPELEAA